MSQEQNYFAELPDEMVLNILELLDYESIKAARVCCVRFEMLLTPRFEESSLLMLDRSRDHCNNAIRFWVFETNKKLKHVDFHINHFFPHMKEFWNLHGENIIYLDFNRFISSHKTLYNILDKVINLKTLKLGSNKEIDGATIINKLYDRCVEITFTSTTFIDKNAITLIAANRQTTIEELNMEYIRDRISIRSSSFQDDGLYQLLIRLQPKLKSLKLFVPYWDDNFVQDIVRLNLNLTKFNVYVIDKLKNSHMLTLTSQMRNLQELHIHGRQFSDENANVIYDNLHELRTLTFHECDELSNNGILNVTKLKKLEEFETNRCQNLSNRGIVDGIAKSTNPVLKHLCLYQNVSDDTLIAIVNNLPELVSLKIESCLLFSNDLIPLIYERLSKLKNLLLKKLNFPLHRIDTLVNTNAVSELLPKPKLLNAEIQVNALQHLETLRLYHSYSCLPSYNGCTIESISKLKNLRHLSFCKWRKPNENEIIGLIQSCRWLKLIEIKFQVGEESSDDQREIRYGNRRIKLIIWRGEYKNCIDAKYLKIQTIY